MSLNESVSMSDVQNELQKIYGSANAALPTEIILVRLSENIGLLMRSLREQANSTDWFVKSLSWIFAYANKYQIDTQDVTLNRYPSICPYCLDTKCVCEFTNKQPKLKEHIYKRDEEISYKYNILINEIKSGRFVPNLDNVSSMIHQIYQVNVIKWRINPYFLYGKLPEELAKLISSTRRLSSNPDAGPDHPAFALIKKDLADVIAWLFALWILSKSDDEHSIQAAFIEKYTTGCPYCNSTPCKCPDERRVGITSLVGEDAAIQFTGDPRDELRKQLTSILDELAAGEEIDFSDQDDRVEDIVEMEKNPILEILGKLYGKIDEFHSKTGKLDDISLRFSRIIEFVERFF